MPQTFKNKLKSSTEYSANFPAFTFSSNALFNSFSTSTSGSKNSSKYCHVSLSCTMPANPCCISSISLLNFANCSCFRESASWCSAMLCLAFLLFSWIGFHLEAQSAMGITPNTMFSLTCSLLSLHAILALSIFAFTSLLCSEARLWKISFSTSLLLTCTCCCCCCLILMSLTFSKCSLGLQSPSPNCPLSLYPQLQTLPSQSTTCK